MASFKSIGKKIAAARKAQNLTQEDLAGLADIDRGFISNIENGRRNFSVALLLNIARSLNTPARDFLE